MSEQENGLRPLSASQQRTLETLVQSSQEQLTADGAEWLWERGVDVREVDTYRLGEVVDPPPGFSKYRGMICIPYLGLDRKPKQVRFRCYQDHDHKAHYHGKYMSMADEPPRMFNVSAIQRAGSVLHVAEGEFDAIILNRCRMDAVAIPGASLFQGRHREMLKGFNTVYLWADPDDAGVEMARKLQSLLRNVVHVPLSSGDVTDTYKLGGETALIEALAAVKE